MKDFKIAVGERLNTILTQRNITQKELAEAIEVKPNVISYFCSGIRTPNSEQIIKISEYLNISVDYLLCRTDIETTDTTIQNICEYTGLTEKAVRLLNISSNSPFYNVLPTLNFIIENDETNIINSNGETCSMYHTRSELHLYLLEKIVSYFQTSLNDENEYFYIQKNGHLCTSSEAYPNTSINDDWDSQITVSSISSSKIVDKVLIDEIVDELKKAKLSYRTKHGLANSF